MTAKRPEQPPKKATKRRPLATSEHGVITVNLAGGDTMRIDSQGRVLCKAHRRDGELCMAPVVAGLRVCRMHGASAPNARLRARQALADLVDPAIGELSKIIEHRNDPDGEGGSVTPADKLRAVGMVLDRTGFGPSQTVEVKDTKALLYERLLNQASDTDDARPDRDEMWTDDDDRE